MKIIKAVAAAALMCAATTAADAAVVVNIAQSGTSVVATTTGSLDLTGLIPTGSFVLSRGVQSSFGYIGTGSTDGASVTGYSGFTGPTSFGTGAYISATSGTGAAFAFNGSAFGIPYVFVNAGYTSGSAIASTSLFANTTLAALGLTSGSYVWRSGNDSVTVTIGAVSGAVPEAGTWAMMILGMGAVGFALRRAKRRSDDRFDAKIRAITAGTIA